MAPEPLLAEPRREAAPPLAVGITPDYLSGYRDSVLALIGNLLGTTEKAAPGAAKATWPMGPTFSWARERLAGRWAARRLGAGGGWARPGGGSRGLAHETGAGRRRLRGRALAGGACASARLSAAMSRTCLHACVRQTRATAAWLGTPTVLGRGETLPPCWRASGGRGLFRGGITRVGLLGLLEELLDQLVHDGAQQPLRGEARDH